MTQGISPKVVVTTLTAVLTYLVTQQLLELPAWAVLLCMIVLVALGGYKAPPGSVTPPVIGRPSDELLEEAKRRGYKTEPR